MANQGILAQSKPSANTNTVLYSAPIDSSASAVLTVANDGTGSAYKVGLKNYDQKLVTMHRIEVLEKIIHLIWQQLIVPILSGVVAS